MPTIAAMRATKNLQLWSTETVEPRHRLGYWLDSICESFLEMNSTPDWRDDFFGRIEVCPLDQLTPTRAVGSAQTVQRDRRAIARSERNFYYLISQPCRAWRLEHAGQDQIVQPGESVLVDSRRPYDFHFPHGLDNLSVELPISWVERWIPEPQKILGLPIQGSSGWGLALRGLREALVPEAVMKLPVPAHAIEDQLGVLLGLASCQWGDEPVRSHAVLARCESCMRERLADPDLAAMDVATSAGTSLRTMHRTFASVKRTFAGSLLDMRLEEGGRMLADARFRRLTIGEIARRCGFMDPSHFARQFRNRQGMGPSEFRAIS